MAKRPSSLKGQLLRESLLLEELSMLDDTFMRVVLKDNIPGVQDIVNVVLGRDDIVVTRLETQDCRTNPLGHSVCLDVLAYDSKDRIYNVEIQRDKRGATPKRVRYHFSAIDWFSLEKRADFDELVETWVIFITDDPSLTQGRPFAMIKRMDVETGEIFDDGQNICIANARYVGDDDFGELMSDIREKNPDKMHYSSLAIRAANVKNTMKGELFMNENEIDGIREETLQRVFKRYWKEIDRVRDDVSEEERAEQRREGREEGREEERKRTVGMLLATFTADSLLHDPKLSHFAVTQAEIDAATSIY